MRVTENLLFARAIAAYSLRELCTTKSPAQMTLSLFNSPRPLNMQLTRSPHPIGKKKNRSSPLEPHNCLVSTPTRDSMASIASQNQILPKAPTDNLNPSGAACNHANWCDARRQTHPIDSCAVNRRVKKRSCSF